MSTRIQSKIVLISELNEIRTKIKLGIENCTNIILLFSNPLEVVNGDGTKYYPHGGSKTYRKDLFCSTIFNTKY